MIRELGLPSIFITLSMAEGSWSHLRNILTGTDNNNPLPTNRPLHTTLHFIHRLQNLKKHVWKNQNISEWGSYTHFFDRIEFQNRGAAHLHGVYWTTSNIAEMISLNTIRSTLPDPNLEQELYQKVCAFQIHTCSSKCGGPAPSGSTCKKGFPRPFSESTHYDPNNYRYTYKCLTPEDQWIIPYHAPTLMIWNAHINVQYITSK
ncbi:14671_t:CDS:1, partial [Dentiscutata heterogama]